MRIRTNMFVTLDGKVSSPDGVIELGYTVS
jgi:hypothetical protein